jgi:hypothetical protein
MAAQTTPESGSGFSLGNVNRLAWFFVFLGAVSELVIFLSISGALCLTAAGTVAIINFRWLEMVVQRVVQADRPKYDLASIFRIIGRFALLAGVLAAVAWMPQIDPVAIVLGFSAPVVALTVEGVRQSRFGGG